MNFKVIRKRVVTAKFKMHLCVHFASSGTSEHLCTSGMKSTSRYKHNQCKPNGWTERKLIHVGLVEQERGEYIYHSILKLY